MNVFKKILSVFMCLCCFALCFSGCSLWSLNTTKYYNQVVASYGDVTVTLEEVYQAYYSYGNYYYDNQGAVTYNGIKKTATQLLNKKLLTNELKDKDSDLYITLTQNELNEVWKNVYSAINSSVNSYEKSLLEADDLTMYEDPETEEETEATDYTKKYTAYEKTYTYDGQLTKVAKDPEIIVSNSDDIFQFTTEEMTGYTTLEDKLASMSTADKAERAYNNFRSTWWKNRTHTQKTSKGEYYNEKAWNKYISNLKHAITDESLSKDTKEVFYRELDRLFNAYYESALLTKLQTNYTDQESISETLVLQTFQNIVTKQKDSYGTAVISDNIVTYPDFVTGMKNRSEPIIYYTNSTKASDWFQVSHVLLKFSDNDVTELTNLKTQYTAGGLTEEEYNYAVQAVYNGIKFTNRETNEQKSAQSILTEIQNALNSKSTIAEKIQAFNEFIYIYNMDQGANNADYAYYIPTDLANDSMVTPFANKSRELRNQGTGSISDLVFVDGINGYTDNNGQTQTPGYTGYHIIIYLGEIETLPIDGSVTLQQLNDYILNPLNNNETNAKTMLDYVLEQISYSNYSNYESGLLTQLKEDDSLLKYYDGVIKQVVQIFE